ncbi:MAG: tetratricopeptide repeat protein [Bryobacteraceae bacterium]
MAKRQTRTEAVPPDPPVNNWTLPAPPRIVWICCALIFCASLLVFSPVRNNDFVDYDDGAYIHHNPPVRGGLSVDGIVWAWTTVRYFYWQPLTWISHMLDVSLFGLDPGPHHIVNLILHSLNGAVLFFALWRLTDRMWPALFAAAVHTLHPLRVESVAWAAERKDVLSGLFLSATVLAYSYYAKTGRKQWYWWMIGLAAAAYCSKPTVVVLPIFLLALDWWPLARVSALGWKPLLKEKLPLFAFSILVSGFTLIGQSEKAMFTIEQLPLFPRLWNALHAYLSYLIKFFYPVHLGVFYPHQPIDTMEAVAAVACMAGISVAALALRHKAGYLLCGWIWFVIGILPTSGITQAGEQSYADRFTYIPAIGLALIVSFGAAHLLRNVSLPAPAVAAAGIVLVAALGWGSYLQSEHWKNTETMCLRAIEATGVNPNMRQILGDLYMRESRWDEAMVQLRELTKDFPELPIPHKDMGTIHLRRKEYPDAVREFQIASQKAPGNVEILKLLGLALIQSGRHQEAAQTLQTVLRLSPSDPQAAQWLRGLTTVP